MNIFAVDENPYIAAQFLCDSHVVKMTVESAQILSTTHRVLDGIFSRRLSVGGKRYMKYWELLDEREHVLYKPTHPNHPSCRWAMENDKNYMWLYEHFEGLFNEYEHRYGRKHSSFVLLGKHLNKPPKNISYAKHRTKFAMAMKNHPECIVDDDVQSYRNFYKAKQHEISMKWNKNREAPNWFKQDMLSSTN